jgi:hypothetical protein
MTTVAAPGMTGRIDAVRWLELIHRWLDDEPTGHEYDQIAALEVTVSAFWGAGGPEGDEEPPPQREDDLRGRAAAIAVETPYVAATPPELPRLSGDLADDVRQICGLTWGQIATVFSISERAVAGWKAHGVPGDRVEVMRALRTIGATLAGGLGPTGVSAWLTAGSPSRLERIRGGELERVAGEAESYRDTPAT